MVGRFWKPYIGRALGDEFDVMLLIGGAEDRAAILYKASKTPNYYIFTLKMATAMSAETFDNSQQPTRLIPESRCCTVNSSRENLRTSLERFYIHKNSKQNIRIDLTYIHSDIINLIFYVLCGQKVAELPHMVPESIHYIRDSQPAARRCVFVRPAYMFCNTLSFCMVKISYLISENKCRQYLTVPVTVNNCSAE
jgi:hypothetical protein